MLPSRHVIVSVPLGIAVGLFTESLFAGILCFLSGLLVDLDHIIEYIIHFGLKPLSYKEFRLVCSKMPNQNEEGGVKKLYLLFHAAEIAILLWVGFMFSKNIYLLSMALGYTSHLVMDASVKVLKPGAFFISVRCKNDFDTTKLARYH